MDAAAMNGLAEMEGEMEGHLEPQQARPDKRTEMDAGGACAFVMDPVFDRIDANDLNYLVFDADPRQWQNRQTDPTSGTERKPESSVPELVQALYDTTRKYRYVLATDNKQSPDGWSNLQTRGDKATPVSNLNCPENALDEFTNNVNMSRLFNNLSTAIMQQQVLNMPVEELPLVILLGVSNALPTLCTCNRPKFYNAQLVLRAVLDRMNQMSDEQLTNTLCLQTPLSGEDAENEFPSKKEANLQVVVKNMYDILSGTYEDADEMTKLFEQVHNECVSYAQIIKGTPDTDKQPFVEILEHICAVTENHCLNVLKAPYFCHLMRRVLLFGGTERKAGAAATGQELFNLNEPIVSQFVDELCRFQDLGTLRKIIQVFCTNQCRQDMPSYKWINKIFTPKKMTFEKLKDIFGSTPADGHSAALKFLVDVMGTEAVLSTDRKVLAFSYWGFVFLLACRILGEDKCPGAINVATAAFVVSVAVQHQKNGHNDIVALVALTKLLPPEDMRPEFYASEPLGLLSEVLNTEREAFTFPAVQGGDKSTNIFVEQHNDPGLPYNVFILEQNTGYPAPVVCKHGANSHQKLGGLIPNTRSVTSNFIPIVNSSVLDGEMTVKELYDQQSKQPSFSVRGEPNLALKTLRFISPVKIAEAFKNISNDCDKVYSEKLLRVIHAALNPETTQIGADTMKHIIQTIASVYEDKVKTLADIGKLFGPGKDKSHSVVSRFFKDVVEVVHPRKPYGGKTSTNPQELSKFLLWIANLSDSQKAMIEKRVDFQVPRKYARDGTPQVATKNQKKRKRPNRDNRDSATKPNVAMENRLKKNKINEAARSSLAAAV